MQNVLIVTKDAALVATVAASFAEVCGPCALHRADEFTMPEEFDDVDDACQMLILDSELVDVDSGIDALRENFSGAIVVIKDEKCHYCEDVWRVAGVYYVWYGNLESALRTAFARMIEPEGEG